MSVLSEAAEKQIEDFLIEEGVVSLEKMDALRRQAASNNTPLLNLLVSQGIIDNERLTQGIAKVTSVPYVNLTTTNVSPDVLTLLPRETAERYMAVPLGEMNNRLVVAMLDADNVQAVDFLSNKIGRPLKVYMATEDGIRRVIKQYDANINSEISEVFDKHKDPDGEQVDPAGETIKNIVQDSPISKALSTILNFAVSNRASDIHIEPMEKGLKIRCRVDGVLREIMKLPKSTEAPLVSRIKILSNLKIDEHRIPQDGQFTVNSAGRAVDLRIAISPVVWGEQVVIRLLDKSGTSLKLDAMGYHGRALQTIRKGLEQPNGMILTSGPTGSGKSTSMYALIQEILSDEINIVTLEDPVEYKMEGVNQIQINPEVGLTFATGLRSVLRQDPDVVMVGEIRDKETATLAVQAALTGHLVFSTLHTNSAAGILPRLLDMGIEPFLIASTVHTVIGQRLVRRIDSTAKKAYQSDPAETSAIKNVLGNILPADQKAVSEAAKDHGYETLPLSSQSAYTIYKAADSENAPGGYKGRMGLYEVFNIDEEIQALILNRSTSSEIQNAAKKQGMVTMAQDGYLKALAGLTTVREVNRVAASEGA